MKKLLLAGVAAAAIGGFAFSPAAHADIISIGLALNGGAITTVATSLPGTGVAGITNYNFGSFNVNNVSGTGNPPLTKPSLLNTNSINVASGATSDILDVYITESDITSFTGIQNFFSGLTQNSISTGWTATLSTYLDPSGGIFALTTLLASASPPALTTDNFTTVADAGAGPYSVTAVYKVTPGGNAGSANSTINVEVPEPGSLALLGTALVALGFIGWMVKRRDAV